MALKRADGFVLCLPSTFLGEEELANGNLGADPGGLGPSMTLEASCVSFSDTGEWIGDNLADVLFTYLFAEVLHQVRCAAEEDGLLTSLPWSPAMRGSVLPVSESEASTTASLHDVTWMDDLSLLAKFNDPSAVSCLERGLTPNLDKGRSTCVGERPWVSTCLL